MSTESVAMQYLFTLILSAAMHCAKSDDQTQQESPTTTISSNSEENEGPMITNWMITTFIVAGSVITFWALCICAFALCLLRLYWQAKNSSNNGAERINSTDPSEKSKSSKSSKSKSSQPFKSNKSNHHSINVNDASSDSDDTQFGSGGSPSDDTIDDNEADDMFYIKDTHNINLEESINGEPSNTSSKPVNGITNQNVIPSSMRKPKKRYSMRAITIDHTALHSKYHSAPVPNLSHSIEPSVPGFNFKHYSNPPGITNTNIHTRSAGSLSNDSHILGSRHYYHNQPPSVDIAVLKQLIFNDVHRSNALSTQILNKYQSASDNNNISRDKADGVVNIKMSDQYDEDDSDDLDTDDSSDEDGSDGSDDDIYTKPQSSDIHLTPTLGGLLVTPIGPHLTPLNSNNTININGDHSSNTNESKTGDGFPDILPLGPTGHSINMEETHDRNASGSSQSGYTYTYSATDKHGDGRDGANGTQIVRNTRMNIQNPPPTVVSDHSVYPSIPSMNQHIPANINVNVPIDPSSLNSNNSKSEIINGADPSSFSAIYEKGVTPDGLSIYNTTITGNPSVLQQQTSSAPSVFKSLTNQQSTATPTYKLPKYNVTKGHWM